MWATLDLEFPDDPAVLRLESICEHWPWWFLRLVIIGKRANQRGQILSGQRPMAAEDLAWMHHRSGARSNEWQQFLDACLDLGLLELQGDIYTITDWRRWHRKPSDEPEQLRDRKNRSRDVAIPRVTSRDNAIPRVTTRDNEMSRVSRHRSDQIRSDQNREDQIRSSSSDEEEVQEEEDFDLDVMMDGLSYLLRGTGSRHKLDLGRIMQWAGEDLRSGEALPQDVITAMNYGLEAARWHRDRGTNIRSLWNYAQTVAAEQLQNAARRRRMAQEAEEQGLPSPNPFRFVGEAQEASR